MTSTEKGTVKNPREIALTIIMDITDKGNFSHKVLSRTLNKYQSLEKKDRAFISTLCEGTIERLITIDYIINCYSKVKVNKMKPLIAGLLRLSVYQLQFMEGIPESAVCNEAVKIAKKRGFTSLSGFINGILRNIIRNPEKSKLPNDLSIQYSVPEWLVKELTSWYDKETVKKILEASLSKKETSIRCNLDKISVKDLKKELEAEGIKVTLGNYLPYALKISGYNSLSHLSLFQKGYFTVQDESSMLVGEVAGVQIGDKIIDVCAAPGGKSLHIASKLQGSGHISARDVSQLKVDLIKENIDRLSLKNISVKVQDALISDEESIEWADVVIADLPCSGLGVIGKKADIKYNMTKEKLESLSKLQKDILTVINSYVKPGGTLIYSTCTINKEENIENVKWFLKEFPFQLESMDKYLPEQLVCESTGNGYLQLVPGIHPSDGFFIAKLRKNI